jgi:hypothetical protein
MASAAINASFMFIFIELSVFTSQNRCGAGRAC